MRRLIATMMIASSIGVGSPLQSATCTGYEARTGMCSNVSADGAAVEIGSSITRDRTNGATVAPPSGGAGRAAGPGASVPSEGGNDLGGNPRQIVDHLGTCQSGDRCRDGGDEVPGAHEITLRDLASFAPAAPTITMEPDGWMLVGLPTNFVAETGGAVTDGAGANPGQARAEEKSGTLFGRPVTVRFTPTAYTWVWGDGTSDTVSTPGRTWAELGAPRFTQTATSHVYSERGTLTISLRVVYAVDYALENERWIRVAGDVTASAAVDAYVGTAKTVLVDGDCLTRPRSPGC